LRNGAETEGLEVGSEVVIEGSESENN